jgi:GT2 family glycosyltransferase
MARPSISVVLPAFRVRHRIAVTARALEVQSLKAEHFEVIFVDDGSDDGTREFLEDWKPPFAYRLIANETNQGRSITRNRGWQAATGDVILFLDGDMIPHPNLLETYQAAFASGSWDVVSGRRHHIDLTQRGSFDDLTLASIAGASSVQELFRPGTSHFEALLAASQPGQVPTQSRFEEQIEEVCRLHPKALIRAIAFITSNVAVTRAALLKTDGFVPLLSRGEDTDLGMQLAERGARFGFEPAAIAIHPFERVDASVQEMGALLDALLTRHPYFPMALAWVWAMAVGEPPFPRLADIARREGAEGFLDIDIEELARERGLRLPASLNVSREALLSYWETVYRLEPTTARAYLERGVGEGLLCRREGGTLYFDRALATSWLSEHTDFRQHVYRHSFFAQHLTARQRGRRDAPARRVRWTGRYQVVIPSPLLRSTEEVACNLALPIETAAQTEIRFDDWAPEALASFVREGVVFAFPLHPSKTDAVSLGYSFSCLVTERGPGQVAKGAAAENLAGWLTPSSQDTAMLLKLLPRIINAPLPAEERARAIYQWILDNTEQRANGLSRSSTARTGLGHCIQLTQLFVDLCRLAGVPARERNGALIDWQGPEDRLCCSEVREQFSPFMHTWAEFHSSSAGWVPVELMPVAHGERVLTPWNFSDRTLRDRIEAEGPLWDQYYFGNLDPYRLHASPWALRLPTLARREDDAWRPLEDSQLAIRHTVRVSGLLNEG